jgi:DNA helicase TIP49 (TBP-interacting protein)
MPDAVNFIVLLEDFLSVTTTGARQTVWYSSQYWMPSVEQSADRNTHRVKCAQVKQIPCLFLVMASSVHL